MLWGVLHLFIVEGKSHMQQQHEQQQSATTTQKSQGFLVYYF